jgi:hypothetical protein
MKTSLVVTILCLVKCVAFAQTSSGPGIQFFSGSTFSTTLEHQDKAVEDALKWGTRAQQLIPDVKETAELIATLKSNIAARSN